jgi:hypothetical protein
LHPAIGRPAPEDLTMKSVLLLALSLSMAILVPSRTTAQETPTVLTRGEYQCQNAFGQSLVALSERSAACLAACQTSPGRQCAFSQDAITRDCLQRARAAAQLPLLRQCAGSDCPECYGGGDCSDYTDSTFFQVTSNVESTISTIFCDDSSSADGLTPAEQKCQLGLARAGERFIQSLEGCFARCQQAVHRGATGFSSCDSAFLDADNFDPRTQRCVERARARFLDGCTGHCQDPPDCLASSCSGLAATIESQGLQLIPDSYCQEPGVCGDRQITGAERCDASATPSGCGSGTACDFSCRNCVPVCGDGLLVAGEFCDESATPNGCPEGSDCVGCDFCEERCGNGRMDVGETCDRNDVRSCPTGTACNASCSSCDPTASATGRLAPCNFFFPSNTWSFEVTAGQNVVVRADDISPQESAGLEFFGNCTNGPFFSGFEDFPCSGAGALEFFCPAATFLAGSDATCSVTLEPVFCSSAPTLYRLDVSGSGLELVSSASPSGAFLDPAP